MKILSDRGIALHVTSDKRPLLTVEQHSKWYTLWLLLETGGYMDVLPVHFGHLEETAAKLSTSAYCDHAPAPDVVQQFAADRHWTVDPAGLKEIVERWLGR